MILAGNKKHWLEEISEKQSGHYSLLTLHTNLSYKEFWNEALNFAKTFLDAGIKENDNVGILCNHSKDFWISVNALWLLNAIPVPLNNRNTFEETVEQINHADINLLLIDPILANPSIWDNSCESIPSGQFSLQSFPCKTLLIEPNEIDKTNSFIEPAQFSLKNSAVILFTSGSSGKSKAVLHTFESLLESVKGTDSSFNLSNGDIWLASLPLYHIGGFMIPVRALLTGSAVAFPGSLKQNDVAEAITSFNPTHVSVVSTTMQRMIESGFKPNSKLKNIFLGGGPSSTELCLKAVNAGWPVIKVYGSTETCSMATALLHKDIIRKPESAGKPIADNQIVIEQGEILIKSNSLFKNYYKDAGSTNIVLREKYYHTGDYGRIDDEGFLFVDSRREDIIITGGENVSVKEIEEAIKSIDNICDVFVFPFNDETWGQIICATVAGKNVHENNLIESLRKKLPSYKIPKHFYFVDHIPRNEMGKVKRNELYKMINLSET
jgi:o-succinylbenzoate---CoA ligase